MSKFDKKPHEVIVLSSSESESESESYELTIRSKVSHATVSPSSVVVKTEVVKNERVKEIEDDDCYILDYNPFESFATDFQNRLDLCVDEKEDDDGDLFLIYQKGEVACRDFPHSRHLCGEFVFNKSPDESCCPQCYCYVCDKPAPCSVWTYHCHATDKDGKWRDMRKTTQILLKTNETRNAVANI